MTADLSMVDFGAFKAPRRTSRKASLEIERVSYGTVPKGFTDTSEYKNLYNREIKLVGMALNLPDGEPIPNVVLYRWMLALMEMEWPHGPRNIDPLDPNYSVNTLINRGGKKARTISREEYEAREKQKQYAKNRLHEHHILTRRKVSPLSEHEEHHLYVLNQLVKQEGGFRARRHGRESMGEGGYRKVRAVRGDYW